ncbi:MAG: TIGR03545 family protein [Candidatus Latescibacteria bacterium]|nr:TIGR03545 family protein [Candidatus Latescibacterota bacterium]
MKLFRWKAIVPLCLLLVLLAVFWLFLLDGIVRRGIEFAGSQITGARVDVESADIRLLAGSLHLHRIEVADPEAPMTNLIEVEEAVADLRLTALLQKKIVVDTLAVRGVRFGTPRTESGELTRRVESTGAVAGRFGEWIENLPIPDLSLEGLGEAVNITEIKNDSLATIRLARNISEAADSTGRMWSEQIRSLDLQAEIDTARVVIERLQNLNLRNLGLRQIREITKTYNTARDLTHSLEQKRDNLQSLRSDIEEGIGYLKEGISGLDETRAADYRYARTLLQIPSLGAPDIGPALFAEMALDNLRPYLNILDKIEQYAPPGLKTRQRAGPERVRMSGTTVHFPRRRSYPAFLLQFAEISLSLGEEGSREDYLLLINGLNSDPAVYGEPTTLSLDRASGAEGERRIRAAAHLDHTTPLAVDSLTVTREGMGMGEVSLGSVGGNLDLGTGMVSLRLVRAGERLDAAMQWNCPSVTWESTTDKSGVIEFVWRTISGLNSVVIDVEIAGTPSRFDLSVRSNVAGELARGLESQLGDQIRRTEARVRSEVNLRIESFVADARNRAEAVESEVEERLAEFQRQLDEVRAELQARIGNLTERLPAGIIPPDK